MAQLQTDKLEVFSERLFRALDRLGGDLLPFKLKESPSAFEKYPRILVALIQRHGVEAGFREWSTKVLRDANKYRKAEEYPELEALRTWMLEHKQIFEEEGKSHLAHLKRSFYGRVYAYLYPRRLLTTAYAKANQGHPDALEEEVIHNNFRHLVTREIAELNKIYDGERLENIIKDAEYFLIANQKRYTWKELSQDSDELNI